MSSRTPASRFTRRALAIGAVAAGIVLVAPAAASAHVGVSPDVVEPEGSAVLTFSFTHGCDESPTTALHITMPDGLTSVSPTVDSAWDIAVEHADNGLVSAVTYTATDPIPGSLRGAASMAVRLGENAPDTLAFPVEQQCESGVNEWVEIAEDGADPHDLDSPAPVVSVAADASEVGDAHSPDVADAHQSEDGAVSADITGTVLGGAGLLAGIAALIVAVLAYRRSA